MNKLYETPKLIISENVVGDTKIMYRQKDNRLATYHFEINKTAYNTDNMGKLLVTLFAFTSAPETNS